MNQSRLSSEVPPEFSYAAEGGDYMENDNKNEAEDGVENRNFDKRSKSLASHPHII